MLLDVANIARIQQRLYPGVGMNGVLPGGLPLGQRDVSDDMAEEDRGITFTVENDENSDGTPLLLPPVVIEAQKGVRGARSVVQIVGAQSHITDLLTLQIDANDAHCLVLTYQFKPEALNLEFEEEQRYNAKLESYHVSLQAMEAKHNEMTYQAKEFRTIVRFSHKLGNQAEVTSYETQTMTIWLVPFEHVEGSAAPRVAKKRKVTL